MRIIHLSESTAGGLGVALRQLVGAECAAGHEVTIMAPAADTSAAVNLATALRDCGAFVKEWNVGPRPGPSVPGEIRSAARALDAADPHLVRLHSSKAGLVGRLVVRGRRPTLFQPHGWSWYAVNGPVRQATLVWERTAVAWCDAVVCVSKDEQRLGRAAGIRARYEIVAQGVDLTAFSPADVHARAAARRALGQPDVPSAVSVGRLHRQKDQQRLVRLWPQVRARVPQALLFLVGDGPDRAALLSAAGEGVVLTGAVAHPHLHYAAADVVVQPSRWEGLSLTILEAFACARSVVATDVAGMAEIVQPGTGATVPAADDAALVDALVDRLLDPARCTREGEAGRALVERQHDLRDHLGRQLALADEVVAARRAGRAS